MNRMGKILLCVVVASMSINLMACAGGSSSDNNAASELQSAEVANNVTAEVTEQEEVIVRDFVPDMRMIPRAEISSKGVAVHDPSIIEKDGTYYIFGSHMTAAKSSDMMNWEMIADGYKKSNPVYGQIYEVADEAFRYAGKANSLIRTDDKGTHVWAPDVIYNEKNGKYYMYYCTSSTWNASNLCYGVSDDIEGPYEWQGALIYSGFNYKTIQETDVFEYVDEVYAKKHYFKNGGYNFEDYPNAIDPTAFYDKDGRMWMVYGSWSGGIFLLELDEETGEVIHPEMDEENNVDAYFGKKLLGGGHISIEGPYIIYDPDSDYYYLFVSYGSLVSSGGYQMRVFRSKTVDGDYVDMNGEYPQKSAFHENYGLKLSGNYLLTSMHKAYMATGHNSAFIDKDGRKYIAYHTRFNDGGEGHSPRVHQYVLNEEGWPCMLPFQTQDESVADNGYKKEDVVGRYFVLNQGTDISSDIVIPVVLYLDEDGTIVGEESTGTWTFEDDSQYIRMVIDDVEYSGIVCDMLDEAGGQTKVFSVVGANESVWGVKYTEEQ